MNNLAQLLYRLGLDWRYSMAKEFWFYFRTCRNWKQVIDARKNGSPLGAFETWRGQVIGFNGRPPFEIFRDVWDHRVYLQNLNEKRVPRHKVKTIADIGANIGTFSLFAEHFWPDAQILAFEPATENYQWLEKNVRASNTQRVVTFPLAVADVCSSQAFYLKREVGWHSIFPDEFVVDQVTVPTIDLAGVINQTSCKRIDFIKMDCEGAEYSILKGNAELLAMHVVHLAMEYHEIAGHSVSELEVLLSNAGFQVQIFPQDEWKTGFLVAHNTNLTISN